MGRCWHGKRRGPRADGARDSENWNQRETRGMIPTRGRKEGKLRLKLGGRGVPGGEVPGPRLRKNPEQLRERVRGRASRRPRAMPGSAQSWKVGACDHERWSQESSATCDGARVEGRWGTGETKPRPRKIRRVSGNFEILSCPAGFKICGLRSTKTYNKELPVGNVKR